MRWTQRDLDNYRARSPALASTGSALAAAPAIASVKAKTPKYRNRKVTDAEGNVHDSGKEHRRWQELQLLARAGTIAELRRQVPFALVVNGVLVCQYVADFVYFDGKAAVVEDCKSPPTRKLAAYRIKAKLMQAIHGVQILEI